MFHAPASVKKTGVLLGISKRLGWEENVIFKESEGQFLIVQRYNVWKDVDVGGSLCPTNRGKRFWGPPVLHVSLPLSFCLPTRPTCLLKNVGPLDLRLRSFSQIALLHAVALPTAAFHASCCLVCFASRSFSFQDRLHHSFFRACSHP